MSVYWISAHAAATQALKRRSSRAEVSSAVTDRLALTSKAPCHLHSHVAPHVTRKPRLVEGEVL